MTSEFKFSINYNSQIFNFIAKRQSGVVHVYINLCSFIGEADNFGLIRPEEQFNTAAPGTDLSQGSVCVILESG